MRTISRFPQVLALSASVLAAVPAFGQSKQPVIPLDANDAIFMRSFPVQGSIGTLSPDGSWAAYSVHGAHADVKDTSKTPAKSGPRPRTQPFYEVWVQPVKGGEAINLSVENTTSWGPVWSPDGKQLAFFSDRDGALRIWMWDPATKKARRVSDAIVRTFLTSETVQWTPDGKQLVVKLLHEGMTVAEADRAGAGAPPAKVTDTTVAPDATVRVYRASAQPKAAAQTPSKPSEGPPEIERVTTPVTIDLSVVDVASGTVRRLSKNDYVLNAFLSPDGANVVYIRRVGSEKNSQQSVGELVLAPVSGAASRVLVPNLHHAFAGAVSWSPNGRWVGFVPAGTRENGDVYVVVASGGTAKKVLTAAVRTGGRGFTDDVRPPVWTSSSDAMLFVDDNRLWKIPVESTDAATALTPERWDHEVAEVIPGGDGRAAWSTDGGKSVYIFTRDTTTLQSGAYKVDLAGGRTTLLKEENKRYGLSAWSIPQVSADGKTLMFVGQDAQHDPNLWIAGADFANPHQLTRVNPNLDKYVFGASRVIAYRNTQGEALHASLLLPAGYEPGKKYPMVVRLYPGPYKHGNRANRFGLEGEGVYNMQMFATRGYAVLFPEAPQRVGHPMRDIADGVLAAVNAAIDLGIADPDRLGVGGHSYGGYSTMSMVVQTNRFKAASMEAGVADLTSFYGVMSAAGGAFGVGWSETGQGLMMATPWVNRDRFVENSPITFLDQVTTPVFIAHGADDTTVPIWQSEQVFIGLRRLGKDVEFRRYDGEGHNIEQPRNIRDYWMSMIRFFDARLKTNASAIQ